MKLTRNIVGVIASIALTLTATAQPVSPVSEGTDGLFSTDTDNTTSLTGWADIDFNKFLVTGTYGFLGASASNSAHTVLKTHVINGAGMFRLGDITFSVSYLGALGGSSDAELELRETEKKEQTPYTEKSNTIPMFHNIRILAGIPLGSLNLGVRAGLDIGGSHTGKTGNGLTLDNIKTFYNKNSFSFKPQFAIGTKIVMDNGWSFSPSIDFSTSVTNSSGIGQSVYSGEDTGPVVSGNGSQYESRKIMRTYTPAGTVGVGIGFPQSGRVAWSANVSYGFALGIQPEKSEYMRLYNGETKKEIISEHLMKSDSSQGHDVTLKFAGNIAVTEKLKVAGRAQFDALYDYTVDGGTTKITNANESGFEQKKTSETHSLLLRPVISAGATYQITDTLSWYGGMKFVPTVYTLQTNSRYTEDGVTATDVDESGRSQTVSYPYLAAFGTGFQFNPAQELNITFGLLFAPSDVTELNTIGAVLNNANLRLGLVWKDVPNN